ncbi:DUF2357 domain-containing protein [Alkalihalobacillus trypoxylicola]|uniref:DUF2357 domain-containing protein n=1 Tax=Alkalihalobacillus trypoxylicola TaxID=519424 RepID=A0A162D1K9_9BACI|nr:DUF2357 domain-containing protein [Alkalihalobacillus trypoxylicola]KYG27728.1 hypothetical protein AZF04_11105 [Alkalihalobacillus trypoxylicola]
MEPLNSGDNLLELWSNEQGWIPFLEAYLTEATVYSLRLVGTDVDVRIEGIPLPFYKGEQENEFLTTFIAPFQSGALHLSIHNQRYETYIYPDERKLTEEQFNQMLEDILNEANSCFQLSGLERNFDTSGRDRELSWTQWSYIERSFHHLRQIFSQIHQQPFRRLEKQPLVMKREKVHRSERMTMQWLDQKGHGINIPLHVKTVKTFETINVYENQVLKQQVQYLFRLLRKYETVEREDIRRKAQKYRMIVQRWLNTPFLTKITENKGPYMITQKFRKHPVYRIWYQWFDSLNKQKQAGIGFQYPISLKDTFQLYEMWCYMKIVNIVREAGYVLNTKELFKTTKDGIFLNLAENLESRIQLKRGISLSFQRSYQYNTKTFHTYTQKMIPDIVIEGETVLVIFDPKYRVPNNLGTALGEMHKYRDGIIHRETGKRAVQEIYILTPTKDKNKNEMRFFQEHFQENYSMGAITMLPGVEEKWLSEKIIGCLERVEKIELL